MTRHNRRAFFGGTGVFPSIVDNVWTDDSSGAIQAAMPATVVAGELLLLFAQVVVGSISMTGAPAGWTQLVAGDDHGWYKWAAGTEGGTNVTIPTSGSGAIMMGVLRIQNANPAQNPEAAVSQVSTAALGDPPALDPSWADANNLFIATEMTANLTTYSAYPANYTAYQQTDNGPNGNFVVAARQLQSSASEDPGSFTYSPLAAFTKRSYTVAVRGA